MIRELAQVIQVEAEQLLVTTELKSGCGSCAQQSTCGAGIISKAFTDRRAQFHVPKPSGDFQPGQQVELLLPEQAVTRYSLLLYGIPIAMLLLVAVLLTNMTSLSEGWIILVAFIGFGLSFVGLQRWLRQRDVQVSRLLMVKQID